MISKKIGQSIIEYVLLAMLVIVGTIVMGPYFIRSIGSHFHLWQEAVDDSIDDRMVQAKGVSIPTICQCGPLQSGACGGHFQTSSASCPVDSRYSYTPCSPPGCGFTSPGFQETCVLDTNFCCANYRLCSNFYNPGNPGCCGRTPLNNPGCLNRPVGVELNAVNNPGTAPSNYSNYCCYNEMALINNCYQDAAHYAFIKCQRVPGQCQPMCTGTPHAHSHACPVGTLTQDRPYTVVPGATCPAPGDACNEICDVGYQWNGTACATPMYQIASNPNTNPPEQETNSNNLPQGPWCFSGIVTSITSAGVGCNVGPDPNPGQAGSGSGANAGPPGQNCSLVVN